MNSNSFALLEERSESTKKASATPTKNNAPVNKNKVALENMNAGVKKKQKKKSKKNKHTDSPQTAQKRDGRRDDRGGKGFDRNRYQPKRGRIYDRNSSHGKKDVKKNGAGKGNWGTKMDGQSRPRFNKKKNKVRELREDEDFVDEVENTGKNVKANNNNRDNRKRNNNRNQQRGNRKGRRDHKNNRNKKEEEKKEDTPAENEEEEGEVEKEVNSDDEKESYAAYLKKQQEKKADLRKKLAEVKKETRTTVDEDNLDQKLRNTEVEELKRDVPKKGNKNKKKNKKKATQNKNEEDDKKKTKRGVSLSINEFLKDVKIPEKPKQQQQWNNNRGGRNNRGKGKHNNNGRGKNQGNKNHGNKNQQNRQRAPNPDDKKAFPSL